MLRSIIAPPDVHPFAGPVLRDALRIVAGQEWSLAGTSGRGTQDLSTKPASQVTKTDRVAGTVQDPQSPLQRSAGAVRCSTRSTYAWIALSLTGLDLAVGLKAAKNGLAPGVPLILPVCKHNKASRGLQDSVNLSEGVLIRKPVECLHTAHVMMSRTLQCQRGDIHAAQH
jgi:hypothetical protein